MAVAIAPELTERVKPTVGAIETAEPVLNFMLPAGVHRVRPCFDGWSQIVGMNVFHPAGFRNRSKRGPGVIEYALIHIADLPIRSRPPHERGNGLDDQAKLVLTLPQSFLGNLSVLDVG